jgi:hypothetical protein
MNKLITLIKIQKKVSIIQSAYGLDCVGGANSIFTGVTCGAGQDACKVSS